MQEFKAFECHCHTCHSRDGRNSVEEMCRRAAELGLASITITDHCEINEYYSDAYHDSIRRSFEDIQKAKERFRGKISVFAGLELAQAVHNLKYAEDAVNSNPYDFILGSIHNIREEQDFFFLDYSKTDVKHFLRLYFQEIMELIEWGNFDSLAHLTYPLRYIVGEHHIPVELEEFGEAIDSILHRLAVQDKALEINTSGLRQAIGDTLPGRELVERFRKAGGRYLTVGSDAHRTEDLGKGLQTGYALAKDLGFGGVVRYERRRPRLFRF